MFDTYVRRVIDPFLNKLSAAKVIDRYHPNQLTIFGFAVGLSVIPLLAMELYTVALVVILINRIIDGLDGILARRKNVQSDFGGFLDIVCDFIFYSAVIFGFALARLDNALAACFLIFSFIACGTAFLSYAIIVEKRGKQPKTKSFYHLGGLTEGTETIVAFVLMCLFPAYFNVIAIIFGAMCWVTTAFRINMAAHYSNIFKHTPS
jgi:phosphatidylglycerophosphate synthase